MPKRYHLYAGKQFEQITSQLYQDSYDSLEAAQAAFLASEFNYGAVIVAEHMPEPFDPVDEIIQFNRHHLTPRQE